MAPDHGAGAGDAGPFEYVLATRVALGHEGFVTGRVDDRRLRLDDHHVLVTLSELPCNCPAEHPVPADNDVTGRALDSLFRLHAS